MADLVLLNMESLKNLDMGSIEAAFREYVAEVGKDCIDRPIDERKRSITVQLDFVPVHSVRGQTVDCDGIKGSVTIKRKLPDRQTGILDFGIKQNGSMYFNPESPADHKQSTMFSGEQE